MRSLLQFESSSDSILLLVSLAFADNEHESYKPRFVGSLKSTIPLNLLPSITSRLSDVLADRNSTVIYYDMAYRRFIK